MRQTFVVACIVLNCLIATPVAHAAGSKVCEAAGELAEGLLRLRYHNKYASEQSIHKYRDRPEMQRMVKDAVATRRPDQERAQAEKIVFFGMKWRSICELERDQ